MDSRGLHGHMRFVHELDSETASQLLSCTFQLVQRDKRCDAGCGSEAEFMVDLEEFPTLFVCRNHVTEPFEASAEWTVDTK